MGKRKHPIEPIIGKLRDELLNRKIFYTLEETQALVEQWRREYNPVRPHSALGCWPPAPETTRPLPPGSAPPGRHGPGTNIRQWHNHWGQAQRAGFSTFPYPSRTPPTRFATLPDHALKFIKSSCITLVNAFRMRRLA